MKGMIRWLVYLLSIINLFSSSNLVQMEAVLKTTPQVVTAKMNGSLLGEFSKLEVDLALKQMSTLKALGSNGMPPIFYQHYWDKIGADVSLVVLTCLNTVPSTHGSKLFALFAMVC